MSEPFVTSNFTAIKVPERSDWQCFLSGVPGEVGGSVVYRPVKGAEPMWFWRQMQYLCFGIRWVRSPVHS